MLGKEGVSVSSSNKKIGYFLIAWLLLNILQAAFMELHDDEAYYWVYSKFLDIGYFDHPPMIALFIKAGDTLFHSTLGVRLITIFTSTISVYLLWKIVKQYAINVSLFILLFASFILFHLYGFIATPDSPLFFFSILFFYGYQRYLKEDNFKWTFYMAIIIAGLLYSKYHGTLIILFTILSNLKLLRRRSFWMIALLVMVFLIPHIWWQIEHGFPAIAYHLFDRSARSYRFSFTTEYLAAQIFAGAPLLGWYFLFAGIKVKAGDLFMRSLKFTFYGIFIFFLLSTFKGRVEAHWTLIGFIPLYILTYIYLSGRALIPKWFVWLAIANIILIILARLLFILPISSLKEINLVNRYKGAGKWTNFIKEKAGNSYVVFNQGFQQPSKYNFYTNTTKGLSYNSRYYRRNQYDIWPIEDSLRGQRIYFVTPYPHLKIISQFMFINIGYRVEQDSLFMDRRMHYGRWINNVRTYQKVEVDIRMSSNNWKPNELKTLNIIIYNPYKDTINFGNTNDEWKCFFEYAFLLKENITGVHSLKEFSEQIIIPPNERKELKVNIKAPDEPGDYKLFFSIRTEPFPGTRNSKMISLKVD